MKKSLYFQLIICYQIFALVHQMHQGGTKLSENDNSKLMKLLFEYIRHQSRQNTESPVYNSKQILVNF